MCPQSGPEGLPVIRAGTVVVATRLVLLRGCEVGAAVATFTEFVHPGIRATGFMARESIDREHLTGGAGVPAYKLALCIACAHGGHGGVLQDGYMWGIDSGLRGCGGGLSSLDTGCCHSVAVVVLEDRPHVQTRRCGRPILGSVVVHARTRRNGIAHGVRRLGLDRGRSRNRRSDLRMPRLAAHEMCAYSAQNGHRLCRKPAA